MPDMKVNRADIKYEPENFDEMRRKLETREEEAKKKAQEQLEKKYAGSTIPDRTQAALESLRLQQDREGKSDKVLLTDTKIRTEPTSPHISALKEELRKRGEEEERVARAALAKMPQGPSAPIKGRVSPGTPEGERR